LDDSTIAAFQYHISEGGKPWTGSHHFLEMMSNLGKIINVRSSTVGMRTNDPLKQPILKADDWKLEELRKYADFFRRWKHMASGQGLTSETFLAVTLMCDTLPRIAIYLISQCGFHYVLLGFLQSDVLEHRFGRYRQGDGANFFIGFLQLCESERKIKIYSALKHSKLELADLRKCCAENNLPTDGDEDVHVDSSKVASAISLSLDVEENEYNIVFYIAGYLSDTSKCNGCTQLLRQEKSCPPAQLSLEASSASFFNIINRGGLKCPSSNLFELCILGYRAFCDIRANNSVVTFLLLSQNAATLFADAVIKKISHCEYEHLLLGQCIHDHPFITLSRRCLVRLFNIFAKKLIADMSFSAPKEGHKIAKLRSSNV
jgi:hypothetical protein